jgi:hypothetical protein
MIPTFEAGLGSAPSCQRDAPITPPPSLSPLYIYSPLPTDWKLVTHKQTPTSITAPIPTHPTALYRTPNSVLSMSLSYRRPQKPATSFIMATFADLYVVDGLLPPPARPRKDASTYPKPNLFGPHSPSSLAHAALPTSLPPHGSRRRHT